MQVTIDRFEGEYAVVELENKTTVKMPKVLVPGAKESDVVEIRILTQETTARKDEIEDLMDEVFK